MLARMARQAQQAYVVRVEAQVGSPRLGDDVGEVMRPWLAQNRPADLADVRTRLPYRLEHLALACGLPTLHNRAIPITQYFASMPN